MAERTAEAPAEAPATEEPAAPAKATAARKCPNCKAAMIEHDNPDNPHTFGAWHCNNCGTCWMGDTPR